MKQTVKKEEYLAKIIHDLKTPASAQVSALKSLLETADKKFSEDETDLIKLTLNSCSYMQKLIDTFSAVFKLNCSKLVPNYEKFNIVDLLNEIIEEVSILLKYNELNLEVITEDEIIINADKLQLRRVIENILSNSINHSYKNSTIQIKITKTRYELTFEVKNNSCYIEDKVLREIFNKYKSYSSVYNRAGVGLGLYLSKEIINAHFGKMIAKSSPENINIFGFVLPL